MLTDVGDPTDPFVGPVHGHPLQAEGADRVAISSPALGGTRLNEAMGALLELFSRGRARYGVLSAPGPGAALSPMRVSDVWRCECRGRGCMLTTSYLFFKNRTIS